MDKEIQSDEMIRDITTADLYALENSLSSFLYSDEVDLSSKIDEAKKILIADIKNNGKRIKWLNTPLSLEVDGTKSDEDEIERLRLVITTTSVTDTVTGVLSGTNDEADETWVEVLSDISIDEVGEYTYIFDKPYKYYKLVLTGTITATAELIETSWELPLKYCSLWRIYEALTFLVGDSYESKANMYKELYNLTFNNTIYSYDWDEDGTVDENEQQITRVQITR